MKKGPLKKVVQPKGKAVKQFNVRMDETLHRNLKAQAALDGMKLEQWSAKVLESALFSASNISLKDQLTQAGVSGRKAGNG